MDTKGKETPEAAGLNWRNKPRRTFTPEQRLAIVRQTEAAGVSVAEVAQRNRVNTNLLFKWKRLHGRGLLPAPKDTAALVPVTVVKAARRKVRRPVAKPRAKATSAAGTIEIEVPGARIYLHGPISEADLASTLRALARR
jgi:transposase